MPSDFEKPSLVAENITRQVSCLVCAGQVLLFQKQLYVNDVVFIGRVGKCSREGGVLWLSRVEVIENVA